MTRSIFFYQGKISGLVVAIKKAMETEKALSVVADKANVKYQMSSSK